MAFFELATTPMVKFKLVAIELLNSSLNTPNVPGLNVSVDYDISVENQVNAELKYIFIITSAQVKNVNDATTYGSMTLSCIYEIENFSEIVKISDQNQIQEIEKQPLDVLTSISISTMRGVMFSEFRGTFLHNAVLPVVDPKTIAAKGKEQ